MMQASRGGNFTTRKDTFQYSLRSVRYAGVKSWNSITSHIKQSPIYGNVLKNEVKFTLVQILIFRMGFKKFDLAIARSDIPRSFLDCATRK